MSEPIITVLMSVYNTKEEYLRTSIESILGQTFDDFEFLIYDDASDEKTKAVLASYNDSRIVLITNEQNRGLTHNLNAGIKAARGKYIARMDADDISYPERLEKCFDCMEKQPETNILGTFVKIGNRIKKCGYGLSTDLRKALCMIENPGLVHPSVMIRRSFFVDNNIYYDEHFRKSQDFDLWARCLEKTSLDIYPEVLLEYRVHGGQISRAGRGEQDSYADEIKMRMIRKTGIDRDDACILRFIRSRYNGEMDYNKYASFIHDMKNSNKKIKYYNNKAVRFIGNWYLFKYIKNNYDGIEKYKRLIGFLFLHNGVSFAYSLVRVGAE